jgi:hypothetical protein
MNANGVLAAAAGVLICVALIGLVFVVLWILFCLTLQRMQNEVRRRNRLIPPGLVWLHMLHIGSVVPFVGPFIGIGAYVWDLIMVLKLSGSLELEFRDRGERSPQGGCGKIIGLIWVCSGLAIGLINVAFLFLGQGGAINPVGNQPLFIALGLGLIALWLVVLICWIIYWVQMAGFKRQLMEGSREYLTGSIEDDYDDEMRGPRRERRRGDDQDVDDDRDRPRRRVRYEDDEDFDDRRGRRHRDIDE